MRKLPPRKTNFIRMQNYVLYFAMFLLILCLPFSGNENEVRWLWEDHLWVPQALTFISLMCIGVYLYKKGKNKDQLTEPKR